MVEAIGFFQLNTGAKIPSVGLGTYKSNPAVVVNAVTAAVKAGYRHIDGAPLYGNENQLGIALKNLFDDGVVKREELWITSKLWCADHDPEDVPVALNRTLQNLQLDYVDLYLIHWPVSMKRGSVGIKPENLSTPNIPSTWRAMEKLYDSGKARAIGVCNFTVKKLEDLLSVARVTPAVNQVECHPVWQQLKLHKFCKSKGIHLTGYSPLGRVQALENPVIKLVAEKLDKTPAQVALRWGLQMGHSVVPKSSNKDRIRENFGVFGWSIPDDLLTEISKIEQSRLVTGSKYVHETYGYYKTLEELWDGEL